jgi:hypothetical protein
LANAYSILHNYDRPLYTPNYNLISTVLQYKQGKLDANRQRLQTVYDQLSVIDVAKAEDQEYVEKRLQTAKDIANKYSALDLSSNGLANDLIGKLTEVVDDNVKNAAISTKIYRSEKAVWDKKRTEKPEEYSEDNYQYAMRGAEVWLNDGQVGTKYNGGGGFIAYDNYDKRLQDNIHNIAKELKATWVVQENGVGMFIDNVTKEAVDRGRLDAALDVFIGKSGRDQMQREAWNRSRFVDEEQLKTQYNAKFSNDLEEADHYLTNLKSLRDKEKNPKKRDEYDALAQAWEQRKGTTLSSPYDAVGREGAYYSLYVNDFKGKYLDAYSYGPRVIKREVDQNHVKSLEFEEKVREFNLNYELKEKELKLKEDKAMREAGIDPVTGQPITNLIPAGKKDVGEDQGYKEMKVSEKELQDFDNALKGLQRVVPGLGETSLSELAEKVSDADIASNQVKEYTIGGKKIKLNFSDPKVRNAIINFDKKAVAVAPEIKALRQQLGNFKGDILNKVIEESRVNPDFSAVFPSVNKMIVGNSKSGFKVVDTDFNSYQALLYKVNKNGGGQKGYSKLSEGEKLTLDMHVYNHMILDPKMDKGLKRQAFNQMRSDLTSKIGYDNFRKLPTSLAKMESEAKVTYGGVTYNLGGKPSVLDKEKGRGRYDLGSTTGILADRAALSDLGFWDTESSGSSMESLFTDGLNLIKTSYDKNLSESQMTPTNTIFEVGANDYRSKALKQAIGQSKNKDNIKLTFLMDKDGNPSGEVQYSYYEYDNDKKTRVLKYGGVLKKEKAEALGFSHEKELKYDFTADYGKDAHVFNLGGVHESEIDAAVRDRSMKSYGGILPMDDPNVIQSIIASAKSTGDPALVNKVLDEIERFQNDPGFIDTKLAGHDEDKMYHLELRTATGGYHSVPLVKAFSTNEVGNFLYDESLYMKHNIFGQYLNKMINTEASRAAIRSSREDIQRMLR